MPDEMTFAKGNPPILIAILANIHVNREAMIACLARVKDRNA